MNILAFLIPISLGLGGVGLLAFFWMMRNNQYDDPDGNANRILSERYDKSPDGEA
mgnify:CR=1 FL=1